MSPTVSFPFNEQHSPRLARLVDRLKCGSQEQSDEKLLERIFLAGMAAMESATANQPIISPAAVIPGRRNA